MNDDKILIHYGIKGQRRGVRRFQNEDGSLTAAGRNRYLEGGGDGWDSRDPNAGNSAAKRMADAYDKNPHKFEVYEMGGNRYATNGRGLVRNPIGYRMDGTYMTNELNRERRGITSKEDSVKRAAKTLSQREAKEHSKYDRDERSDRESSEIARLNVQLNGDFTNGKSSRATTNRLDAASRVKNTVQNTAKSVSNAVQTGAKSVSSAVSKAYSASKETISKAVNSGKSAISTLLSRFKKK